jgi:hypothetical protein
LLVELGQIVADNREKVRSPRSVSDVWTAKDSVQTAAERL